MTTILVHLNIEVDDDKTVDAEDVASEVEWALIHGARSVQHTPTLMSSGFTVADSEAV